MFKTLDDYKDPQKKEKKPGDKETSSYTGGGKSGLAVENPNQIDDIVAKAQKPDSNMKQSDCNCKITLYSNGFTVDDGEFRDYNLPENDRFMKEINKGVVPKELRAKYPNGIQVGLEDKRPEAFIPPPPPKYIAFSGQGVSLSGVSKPQEQDIGKIDLAATKPKINEGKPKTTIQIRLHNGQKTIVTMNLDEKVIVLFDYVMRVAPVGVPFQLLSGYPATPIENVNQTIEEAGLQDSAITQKLT